MKYLMLVIGDEILSGRTQDRNIAQIASWLNLQGVRLAEVRVVADDDAVTIHRFCRGQHPAGGIVDQRIEIDRAIRVSVHERVRGAVRR